MNYAERMSAASTSAPAADKPSRCHWIPRARNRREGRIVCWIVVSVFLVGQGSRALFGWGLGAVAAAWLVGAAGLALFGRWQKNHGADSVEDLSA